jgi:ribonuclease T2
MSAMRLSKKALGCSVAAAIAMAAVCAHTISWAFSWPDSAADGWVLSLSWSPQYCYTQPVSEDRQCKEEHYFATRDLRPEYPGKTPSECAKDKLVPEDLVFRMLSAVPNKEFIKRAWRRNGRCTGLTMQEYLLQLEYAGHKPVIPGRFVRVTEHLDITAVELKNEFIKVNPGLDERGILLTCSGRWLKEVAFCMSKDYSFRECSRELEDDCGENVRLRRINPDRLD